MAGPSFADKARRVAPFLSSKHKLAKVVQGKRKPTAKQRAEVNAAHALLFGRKRKDTGYVPGLVNGTVYPFTFDRTTKKGEAAYQKLRQATGQEDSKLINTVFVPTIEGKSGKPLKPRLRVKKDGTTSYDVNSVRQTFEKFNRRRLATDPDAEIERVLKLFPKASAFHIKCGRSLSKHQFARRSVGAKVKQWMAQYDNWGKWMRGVEALEFLNQSGRDAYLKARTAYLDRKKVKKVKGKRRGK